MESKVKAKRDNVCVVFLWGQFPRETKRVEVGRGKFMRENELNHPNLQCKGHPGTCWENLWVFLLRGVGGVVVVRGDVLCVRSNLINEC